MLDLWKKNGEKIRLELDVGLHAFTNYSEAHKKKSTFNKLFRSLRLDRTQLEFCEQNFSWIKFGDKKLTFTNKIEDLTKSIEEYYPAELIGWNNYLEVLKNFNEFSPEQPNYLSAKIELKKYFKNEEFINHLLFPVMSYGSAWEEDMDYYLFVCIFRSMFLEGLCRPHGGIRAWWKLITDNLQKYQVEMIMGEKVQGLHNMPSGEIRVTTSKREIVAKQVYSSAGLFETQQLQDESLQDNLNVSPLGFIELMVVFDQDFTSNAELPTLAFYVLDTQKYFHSTKEVINTDMAIYCFPSRYKLSSKGSEEAIKGLVRMTCMTNPKLWFNYSADDYRLHKEQVTQKMLAQLFKDFPHFKHQKIIFSDIFTPKTIHKYTLHHQGALYGATLKVKEGICNHSQLVIIGADQGYPGIIGSMMSGVTMANVFGIMKSKNTLVHDTHANRNEL